MLVFSSPGHPACLDFTHQSNQRNLYVYLHPPSLTYLPIYDALHQALVRVCVGQLRYSAVSLAVVYILSRVKQFPSWRIPRVLLVRWAVWSLCRGGRRDLISFPEIFMKNRRPQIFHVSTGAGYFSCHSSLVSEGHSVKCDSPWSTIVLFEWDTD